MFLWEQLPLKTARSFAVFLEDCASSQGIRALIYSETCLRLATTIVSTFIFSAGPHVISPSHDDLFPHWYIPPTCQRRGRSLITARLISYVYQVGYWAAGGDHAWIIREQFCTRDSSLNSWKWKKRVIFACWVCRGAPEPASGWYLAANLRHSQAAQSVSVRYSLYFYFSTT